MNERTEVIVQGAELTEQEKAWVNARLEAWGALNEGQRKEVEQEVRAKIPPERMHTDAARYLRAQGIAQALGAEQAPVVPVFRPAEAAKPSKSANTAKKGSKNTKGKAAKRKA